MVFAPRLAFVLFLLAAAPALASCGGGSTGPSGAAPFVATWADDTPGGGGTPAGETTPAPSPLAPFFDGNAYRHDRSAFFGSFSSDVVRHGATVFTNDADQLETDGARIVPLDVGGASPIVSPDLLAVTIRATDLVDSAGAPGSIEAAIGFGFFLNDIEVVSDALGFVLVNAGGSDSAPSLSNLVAFDPTRGRIVQVVDLANTHAGRADLTDSAGGALPPGGFVQSGAEALAYVQTSNDGRGRLYVAMTNLVFGAPSYGAVKYPGTVQVFDVDPAAPVPVRTRPKPGLVTETLLTRAYNPVAISPIEAGFARESRLLVTLAGTTGYDESHRLVPVTPAAVEAYAVEGSRYLGRFELGLAGLAATRPALGRDGRGHRVGFFPSAVNGEVYLLRLDGLHTRDVDDARLAVLRGPGRGIPIASEEAGGPGANVTGVLLLDGGRILAVAGFGDLFASPAPRPGRLYLLGLPGDLVTGADFGANFVPGATLIATTPGRALGALAAGGLGGGRPDLYVTVSGGIDPSTYLGTGPASLGALWLNDLFD